MGDINQKMQVIIRIVFLLLVLISRPKLAAVYCERIRHLIKESKRKTEIFLVPGLKRSVYKRIK